MNSNTTRSFGRCAIKSVSKTMSSIFIKITKYCNVKASKWKFKSYENTTKLHPLSYTHIWLVKQNMPACVLGAITKKNTTPPLSVQDLIKALGSHVYVNNSITRVRLQQIFLIEETWLHWSVPACPRGRRADEHSSRRVQWGLAYRYTWFFSCNTKRKIYQGKKRKLLGSTVMHYSSDQSTNESNQFTNWNS